MKTKYLLLIYIFSSFMLLISSSITTVAIADSLTQKESVFDVTTQIFVNGNLISSPRIIARTNQQASLAITDKREPSKSFKLNLIAKNNQSNIEMNFDVHYKDGKEKIHATPRFILANKQEGIIKIHLSSNHLFEMRVHAERQKV